MVKVVKVNRSANKNKRNLIKNSDYSLPKTLTTPSEELLDYSFMFYGPKKIGKTSLCARFPKALFFMFEPGSKALRVYKLPKKNSHFEDFRDVIGYVDNMKKTLKLKKELPYSTSIFDTGSAGYNLCLKYGIKHLLHGKHPGEIKDYGASWNKVTQEFQKIHLDLANLGMGFVCLGHEDFKDFEGADGKEYTKVQPKFSKASNDFYESIIDVIGHYHYVGKERWLQIGGDEFTVAGCRIEDKFLTPRGAKLNSELMLLDKEKDLEEIEQISEEIGLNEKIVKIPMGNSPDTSFNNLMRAFQNKQTQTFKEINDTEKGGALKKVKKLRVINKKKKLTK